MASVILLLAAAAGVGGSFYGKSTGEDLEAARADGTLARASSASAAEVALDSPRP
jgi:hypothetical protein